MLPGAVAQPPAGLVDLTAEEPDPEADGRTHQDDRHEDQDVFAGAARRHRNLGHAYITEICNSYLLKAAFDVR